MSEFGMVQELLQHASRTATYCRSSKLLTEKIGLSNRGCLRAFFTMLALSVYFLHATTFTGKKKKKVLPKASYFSPGVFLAVSKPKPRCSGFNGQGLSGKEKLKAYSKTK